MLGGNLKISLIYGMGKGDKTMFIYRLLDFFNLWRRLKERSLFINIQIGLYYEKRGRIRAALNQLEDFYWLTDKGKDKCEQSFLYWNNTGYYKMLLLEQKIKDPDQQIDEDDIGYELEVIGNHFDQAQELEPDSLIVIVNKYLLSHLLKEKTEYLQLLTRVLEDRIPELILFLKQSQQQGLINLIIIDLCKARNYKLAQQVLEEHLPKDPQEHDQLYQLALINLVNKKYVSASNHIRKAIDLTVSQHLNLRYKLLNSLIIKRIGQKEYYDMYVRTIFRELIMVFMDDQERIIKFLQSSEREIFFSLMDLNKGLEIDFENVLNQVKNESAKELKGNVIPISK